MKQQEYIKTRTQLIKEWENVIEKYSNYHDTNYQPTSTWYKSLKEQERDNFDEFLLEHIHQNGSIAYHAFWTAFEIGSTKLYNHFINILREALRNSNFNFVKERFIKFLWQYNPSKEIKDILLEYFSVNIPAELRFAALQTMSRLFPDLALELSTQFKQMYLTDTKFDICFIYSNLINAFGEGFPTKLSVVSSNLSGEELQKVFNYMPFLLSSEKWNDKRETIISELERLFNTKIERKLKL